MKVIQNNYKNTQRNTYQLPEKTKPRVEKVKIECENCGSVIEVSREDVHTGWLGLPFITCPCCNYEMVVKKFNDDVIDIYASNVNYPTHFKLFSKDFIAVEIPDDGINECIQNMYRHTEDEEYYVIVSKDYEEGRIQFEEEDYD